MASEIYYEFPESIFFSSTCSIYVSVFSRILVSRAMASIEKSNSIFQIWYWGVRMSDRMTRYTQASSSKKNRYLWWKIWQNQLRANGQKDVRLRYKRKKKWNINTGVSTSRVRVGADIQYKALYPYSVQNKLQKSFSIAFKFNKYSKSYINYHLFFFLQLKTSTAFIIIKSASVRLLLNWTKDASHPH